MGETAGALSFLSFDGFASRSTPRRMCAGGDRLRAGVEVEIASSATLFCSKLRFRSHTVLLMYVFDDSECGTRFAIYAVEELATVEIVFPAECPTCRCAASLPFKAVTMANGNVCVTLRCRLCRHEWELELCDGRIALAPKQDRRSLSRLFPG